MQVHLVDGTYELFRHHYGIPAGARGANPLGGARGVIDSLLGLLSGGATHLGVATDHVIESFRNDLWPGYKSSQGMDPAILGQFGVLEEAITALGVRLWPMTDLEADDALASAASVVARDPAVEQVLILSPDKDLAQCVVGDRVVQVDRRKRETIGAAGVRAKFGVDPESIPDWLALVGDAADGYPGLPGWGGKSAAALLAHYRHIDSIPHAWQEWKVAVRGAPVLAMTLLEGREALALFLNLARLRIEPSLLSGGVEEVRWRGPTASFPHLANRLGAPQLSDRAVALARR